MIITPIFSMSLPTTVLWRSFRSYIKNAGNFFLVFFAQRHGMDFTFLNMFFYRSTKGDSFALGNSKYILYEWFRDPLNVSDLLKCFRRTMADSYCHIRPFCIYLWKWILLVERFLHWVMYLMIKLHAFTNLDYLVRNRWSHSQHYRSDSGITEWMLGYNILMSSTHTLSKL